MTKFVHIVQVHPVENGEPNLYKVKFEEEFEYRDEATASVIEMNILFKEQGKDLRAVYYGCVNDETGELV